MDEGFFKPTKPTKETGKKSRFRPQSQLQIFFVCAYISKDESYTKENSVF